MLALQMLISCLRRKRKVRKFALPVLENRMLYTTAFISTQIESENEVDFQNITIQDCSSGKLRTCAKNCLTPPTP